MKFQVNLYLSQFVKSRLGTGWAIASCSILFLAVPVRASSQSQGLEEITAAPSSLEGNFAEELAPDPSLLKLTDRLAQLTSVGELSDVQPTDWAYQALTSLIGRYGAISGYPDGTFRGNRSLSRYEFAAALLGVLKQINNGTFVSQEDLVTLQRLETEYRQPLEQIRTRLNDINSRVTNLETNQFSSTSSLQGEVIFALTEGRKANPTTILRQRLNFITSFTPNSRLITQLEVGNNGADEYASAHNRAAPNLLGTTGLLADGGGLEYSQVADNVQLRRLYYTFRPFTDLQVTVGAKMPPEDFIDRNRYANNESSDFSSSFFVNNPLIVQNQIDRPGGAGAALAWNIGGGAFTVRSLYIAANSEQVSDTELNEGGLFGDRNSGTIELEYLPRSSFALRLQYTKALINNTDITAFGINAEYAFNRTTAVFGRFGIGNYDGFNPLISQNLDLQPRTWAVGLSWRDLVLPGTLTGVAIGQPFVEADLGDATQTNFEAFYKLQLSDNLSISPIVQLVNNANNDSSNGLTWQTTLRTSFIF